MRGYRTVFDRKDGDILKQPANVDVTFPCTSGIDSRYNVGCTELAKYLFYGLYGRNPLNLDSVLEEFPEEMLDGEFWFFELLSQP